MQKDQMKVDTSEKETLELDIQTTHKFLVHKKGDHVGVATEDIFKGETVIGFYMDEDSSVEVVASSDVPLGHKISVARIQSGNAVIEYGLQIGLATVNVQPGDYVHVHNIKSARW